MAAENSLLQKVIALCSRHGYIYRSQRFGSDGHRILQLFDLGPLGVELKQNICHEWWYSMVTSHGNVYGTESPSLGPGVSGEETTEPIVSQSELDLDSRTNLQEQQQETSHSTTTVTYSDSVYQGTLLQYLRIKELANKQLPFGTAQRGTSTRCPGRNYTADKFVYDAQKLTQLSVQYYCSPRGITRLLDTWQRDRLNWWRKFAENPSNFIATDLQTIDDIQFLDVQYKFPWGSDTIERIYNRGKGPMEQYLSWMERGLIDMGHDSTGESDNVDEAEEKKDGGSQKNLTDLLKGKEGRKQILPHSLEMTTTVEHGMLAYLLDGYVEKARTSRSGGGKVRLKSTSEEFQCSVDLQRDFPDVR